MKAYAVLLVVFLGGAAVWGLDVGAVLGWIALALIVGGLGVVGWDALDSVLTERGRERALARLYRRRPRRIERARETTPARGEGDS